MAHFARSLFANGFAAGVLRYEDYYPGETSAPRIVLPVEVAGDFGLWAIVDTGAPWCVLHPQVARLAAPASSFLLPTTDRLLLRGVTYRGWLLRFEFALKAEEGSDLDVDATVFVPNLRPNETWPHPNFIGLDGFLNRIRYAIDPAENAFYFGLAS